MYATFHLAIPSPFYDRISIALPGKAKPLVVSAEGATSKQYVQSLSIDGEDINTPIIRHEQIVNGAEIKFTMSDKPTTWASPTLVGYRLLAQC